MYEFFAKRAAILRVVGIYALASLLWIYASDTALGWLALAPRIMVQVAIYKGSFFVVFSSLLLYALMTRYHADLDAAGQALRAQLSSLAKSEERLSLALLVTSSGIWDWNLKSGEVFFEANYFKLAGYEPNEFAHSYAEWEKRVHPADLETARQAITAYLTGSAPIYAVEFRFKAKDGSWIWILGQGKVFERDERGEPVRFAGTHTDVSARKRAQEQHRSDQKRIACLYNISRRRFTNEQEFLDHALSEALVLTASEFGYIYFYDEGRRQFTLNSWSRGVMDACQVLEPQTVYPLDATGIWGEAVRQRRPILVNDFRAEHPFKRGHPEGHVQLSRFLTLPVMREESIVAVVGVANKADDYTDGDALQLKMFMDSVWSTTTQATERKRAQEALQESENRLRFALEGANDGIWDVSLSTGKTYLSPRGCEILGYGEDELGEVVKVWSDLVHPDDLQPTRERLQAHLDGATANFEVEQRLRTKSGDWKWISTRGKVAERDAEGVAVRITGTHSDLTRQKELEAQLQQAQKMESVGVLAGGVAHDFNNMLSVILGHTFLAISDPDPAQLQLSLDEIRKAAERSADLTRQLLAFARKQTIVPRVLDLNQTVAGMLKMLQRLVGEGINIHWQPERDLWLLKMDPSQIDQLLANLCVNARDSIADIGKVAVETGSQVLDESYCAHHLGCQPGEYVRLSVTDDGCGMSKETLSRIFEPFFTTKGVGKGTGLGLSTVYGIVKQNGGFIDVYSEPGLGTSFHIYLPRHRGEAEPAATEHAAQPTPQGLETVLLVEDELAILTLTEKILTKLGYRVLSANSAGEALRIALTHQGEIGLLITDVVMPEMNGKELAINLQSKHRQLKTLYISGYTAEAIAHHGVLDEGVHFLQKPFSVPGLGAKVREVLDN